jgi:hypothetical protein
LSIPDPDALKQDEPAKREGRKHVFFIMAEVVLGALFIAALYLLLR